MTQGYRLLQDPSKQPQQEQQPQPLSAPPHAELELEQTNDNERLLLQLHEPLPVKKYQRYYFFPFRESSVVHFLTSCHCFLGQGGKTTHIKHVLKRFCKDDFITSLFLVLVGRLLQGAVLLAPDKQRKKSGSLKKVQAIGVKH